MAKTNKAKIIELCNSINKKEGEGSIYTIGSKGANLKINRWSTGIEDLDAIIGGGMPEGRVIEIFGAESCIAEDTHIAFRGIFADGKEFQRRGGTVKKLYEIFHGKYTKRMEHEIKKHGKMQYYEVTSMVEGKEYIKKLPIADVVYNGIKECFLVITENGHSIKCTRDHKFYVGNGEYKKLEDIKREDNVYTFDFERVHGCENTDIMQRVRYSDNVTVKNHPDPWLTKHTIKSKGVSYLWHRIPKYRLIVEASMNNMSYDKYVWSLNNLSEEEVKNLQYVDTSKYDIHHKDFNHWNNDLENLQVITKEEHSKIHANENQRNLSFIPTATHIKSVKRVGMLNVYDIKCYSPNNNYFANNILVHNCGKTTLAYHLCGLHSLCLDIPIEGTFDSERARVFRNKPKQMLVYRARYGEDAFNKTIQFAKAGIPLVVIDSVPSMLPKEDVEKVTKSADKDSIEEQRIGGVARLMNKYLPVIEDIIEITGTTVVFINQVRDKMQALLFGEKTDTPGGHKLKHSASLRIQVARKQYIEIPNKDPRNSATNKAVGMIMKCKVIKSKVSEPKGECELPLFYDRGFVSFDDVKQIRDELMEKERVSFSKGSKKASSALDDWE